MVNMVLNAAWWIKGKSIMKTGSVPHVCDSTLPHRHFPRRPPRDMYYVRQVYKPTEINCELFFKESAWYSAWSKSVPADKDA